MRRFVIGRLSWTKLYIIILFTPTEPYKSIRFPKFQEFSWRMWSLYGVCKRHMIRRWITANIIINTSKTYLRKTLLLLINRHTRLKKRIYSQELQSFERCTRYLHMTSYTAIVYICLSATKMVYCRSVTSPSICAKFQNHGNFESFTKFWCFRMIYSNYSNSSMSIM